MDLTDPQAQIREIIKRMQILIQTLEEVKQELIIRDQEKVNLKNEIVRLERKLKHAS